MNKTTAKEYLAEIAALAEDVISGAAVQNTENGAVLLMTAASPFGEDEEISYSVSLEEFKEDMYIFHTMIYAFTNVPVSLAEDISAVIAALDPRITLGSCIYYDELDAVIFSHAFLLDKTVTAAAAARILLRSIGLMENAVYNTGAWIRGLLEGKNTAAEVIAALEDGGDANDR